MHTYTYTYTYTRAVIERTAALGAYELHTHTHTYIPTYTQAPIERTAASGVPDYIESEIYAHEHDAPNVRVAENRARTTLNRAAGPPTPVITNNINNDNNNMRDVDTHYSSSTASAHSNASSPAMFSTGTDTPESLSSPHYRDASSPARNIGSQASQSLPISMLPMLPPAYMHHTLSNFAGSLNSGANNAGCDTHAYEHKNLEHVCVVFFPDTSPALLAALLGYMLPAYALKTAVCDANATVRDMWVGVEHQEGRFPHQVCVCMFFLFVHVYACICDASATMWRIWEQFEHQDGRFRHQMCIFACLVHVPVCMYVHAYM